MIGQTVGHYNIVERLGEGGMGVVYKARDLRLERFVALKVLPADKMADADRLRRLIQEAKAASALNHPNIITIHEIAEYHGQTFIVMELVEGKPLNELIPRKGMRLTEALRIAVQIADALTAAHSAALVHRDLKPGNIMLDTHGRVKVLDFGLAKLSATAASVIGVDEPTRTITMQNPHTEEGVILGSIPYMSPEQVEGKPLDARSDIFSFGAVLYEMITGQRAFRGESRASTLAAVVEKEPRPPGEIVASTPAELERLITRCLRKDVNRRSQNMTDVKLVLEELRDESESGKLVRSGTADAGERRFLWPVLVTALIAAAAVGIGWTYLNRGGAAYQGTDLVRLSPDDGNSYYTPSISADGKFVAYVSDRSGSRQLWLQQVAGGAPIQLTHSADQVLGVQFLPDGSRVFYATKSADGMTGGIAVIPTLGGEPRVLAVTRQLLGGALSPNGLLGAYFESDSSYQPSGVRLMVLSSEGGQPRELSSWKRTQPLQTPYTAAVWTSDSRYLLCVGSRRAEALNLDDWEWFAVPVDGGAPLATGAGPALRAAGLKISAPTVVVGDRVLFGTGKSDRSNVWEVRLSPGSWRLRSGPRQLTFGTENQYPFSSSASGTVALDIFKDSTDSYLIPLSPTSGQPTGTTRRLTHDGRYKELLTVGGDPGQTYFRVFDYALNPRDAYALDLQSGRQKLEIPGFTNAMNVAISLDGRRVAYSIPEGSSYSIRVGDSGATPTAARLLCKACGMALRFSADGRFLFFRPEAAVERDPSRKYSVRLLDVASGKQKPWLEHPADSIIAIGTFGQNLEWVVIRLRSLGSRVPGRVYLVPWREEPVPLSDWIEVKVPMETSNYSPAGNFFQFFRGGEPVVIRFDPRTRTLSEPSRVRYVPGSDVTPRDDDSWAIRGPGLVFWRKETTSSVWLMKLAR